MNANGIHWRAPMAIVASLLAGSLFAIGHHVFYRSQAGNEVRSTNYNVAGITVSPQQVNIAVGTAFAFLVQSCLTTAVAVAYAQVLWTKCIGRPAQLKTLDTIFSAMSNAFQLFRLTAWWNFRLLFMLALIAWLIPVASVVAPASLTVVQHKSVNSSMTSVPSIDFNKLDFAAPETRTFGVYNFTHKTGVQYYKYMGPQLVIQQLALAVAAQGAILPITPPSLNASWSIGLVGPKLACKDVTGGLRTAIESDIRAGSFDCLKRYAYIAWTPAMDDAMPFLPEQQASRTAPLNPVQSITWRDVNSSDLSIVKNTSAPATLYVAALPGIDSWVGVNRLDLCKDAIRNSTILQCSLYNSSRTLLFNYTNGAQAVTATDVSLLSQEPIPALGGVYGPGDPYYSDDNCSTLNTDGVVCVYDRSTAQNLGYQALMESFGKLLVGSVRWPPPGTYVWFKNISNASTTFLTPVTTVGGSSSHYGSSSSSSSALPSSIASWDPASTPLLVNSVEGEQTLLEETLMTSTALLGLPIFERVRLWAARYTYGARDLRDRLKHHSPAAVERIFRSSLSPIDLPLEDALEQLFDNITISLMSDYILKPNRSDAVTLSANVTFTTYSNIYKYSPEQLWLSYGFAILFTCFSTVVGFIAIFADGACYTTDFSTILRTTRKAHITEELRTEELSGSDPLPSRIREVFITLGDVKKRDHQDTKYSIVAQSADT